MNRFPTLHAALAALPVGADRIADHLAASGVRGKCGDAGKCAIAEYLTRVVDMPEGHYPLVTNTTAEMFDDRSDLVEHVRFAGTMLTLYKLTLDRDDISTFIGLFDGASYPDLIVQATECERVAA